MSEEDARSWIQTRFGAAATARVARLLALVIAGNERQNLIAPSTVPLIWSRHALDSAQLVTFGRDGMWVDVGTGGGFPGLVVALLRADPILLVEPRRKRAEFLTQCATELALTNVGVLATKVEQVTEAAAVISARAVAPMENLLQIAAGCAKEDTRWLLPRGRSAQADLANLRRSWQGIFHVEHSLTDPDSAILVLDGVRSR